MKKLDVYKCNLCGNIVELLHVGDGDLVCCGEKMELLTEKTADQTTEKHVPVVEKIEGGYKVTVGTTLHPMTEAHYIEWIELVADGFTHIAFLAPNEAPSAVFQIGDAKEVYAREYCNLHGLWISPKEVL
jgi:superoxide reductase